jgi:peptidoglycan/LPS O-acetylase OafA/YrhL
VQKYRSDIDGLRALAVLPAVFFHAHIPGFSGGYVGVDVFFVISGYLITSIIHSEMTSGHFSILTFYERRIRRILPALFTVIFFCVAAAWFLFLPDEMKLFGRSLIATILFSSNILFWEEAGYFDHAAATKPLLHTWSLAVEEQFYIAFPIALLLCARYMPRRLPWAIGAAALGSFILSLVAQRHWPDANFYLPFPRAWELLVGALLALNVAPVLRNPTTRDALAVIGLAALGSSVFLYDSATSFPGLSALPPVLGAALVIHAGMHGPSHMKALLGRRELVFIGLISYSLYLWHWPLLVFARMLAMKDLSLAQSFGIISLAFLLAALSWRYVERPFRVKTALAARLRLFAATFAAMIGFIVVGSVLIATLGLPQRLPENIRRIASAASQAENFSRQYDCVTARLAESELFGPCPIGQKGKPTVAVWGDSQAMALKPLFDTLFKEQNVSGLLVSLPGCPPVFELARVDYGVPCLTLSDRFSDLLKASGIGKLVLVGYWNGIFFDKNTDWHGRQSFNDETRYENIRLSLQLTLKRLKDSGIQVAFMMPVPGAKEAVPQALARAEILGRKADIEFTREEYERRTRPLDAILAAAIPVDATIHVEDDLCTETCAVARNGKPLYFNEGHPNLYLNEFLLPVVRPQLRAFLDTPLR